ncbi:hypothetical protein KC349_g44 [Hortaea werneckii]|nr:hypothetical protein KC349_g44 [Hortaea werneckii]
MRRSPDIESLTYHGTGKAPWSKAHVPVYTPFHLQWLSRSSLSKWGSIHVYSPNLSPHLAHRDIPAPNAQPPTSRHTSSGLAEVSGSSMKEALINRRR